MSEELVLYLKTLGRSQVFLCHIQMHRSEEDFIEWYIVFSEAKYDHWVFRFIDKKMGHVYAVKDLNDYQWLVVQPRVSFTEVKVLIKTQYPTIRTIADIDDKIIKVRSKVKTHLRGALNWFSCVEQVKALIGVKSFWTITPKQLYRGLMENRYG